MLSKLFLKTELKQPGYIYFLASFRVNVSLKQDIGCSCSINSALARTRLGNCPRSLWANTEEGFLDERAYQRKDALNVRGNAFSFPLPWDGIAAKLKQVIDGEVLWDELPYNGAVLAKTVLFSLRIGNVIYGQTLFSDRLLFYPVRPKDRQTDGCGSVQPRHLCRVFYISCL